MFGLTCTLNAAFADGCNTYLIFLIVPANKIALF